MKFFLMTLNPLIQFLLLFGTFLLFFRVVVRMKENKKRGTGADMVAYILRAVISFFLLLFFFYTWSITIMSDEVLKERMVKDNGNLTIIIEEQEVEELYDLDDFYDLFFSNTDNPIVYNEKNELLKGKHLGVGLYKGRNRLLMLKEKGLTTIGLVDQGCFKEFKLKDIGRGNYEIKYIIKDNDQCDIKE